MQQKNGNTYQITQTERRPRSTCLFDLVNAPGEEFRNRRPSCFVDLDPTSWEVSGGSCELRQRRGHLRERGGLKEIGLEAAVTMA